MSHTPSMELALLAATFYDNAVRNKIAPDAALGNRIQQNTSEEEIELIEALWDHVSRGIDAVSRHDNVSHDPCTDHPLRDAVVGNPYQGLQLVEVFTAVLRRNLSDADLKSCVPATADKASAENFRRAGAHNLALIFGA